MNYLDNLDNYVILYICDFLINDNYNYCNCFCKYKELLSFSYTCKNNYYLLKKKIESIKITTYNLYIDKKYITTICNIHDFQEIDYFENLKIK